MARHQQQGARAGRQAPRQSLIQGLILPHALREVLRHLPPEGEDEEDHDWGDDWRKFLEQLDVATEPKIPPMRKSLHLWVEDAVDRFSRLKRFAELVRGAVQRSEADNA